MKRDPPPPPPPPLLTLKRVVRTFVFSYRYSRVLRVTIFAGQTRRQLLQKATKFLKSIRRRRNWKRYPVRAYLPTLRDVRTLWRVCTISANSNNELAYRGWRTFSTRTRKIRDADERRRRRFLRASSSILRRFSKIINNISYSNTFRKVISVT